MTYIRDTVHLSNIPFCVRSCVEECSIFLIFGGLGYRVDGRSCPIHRQRAMDMYAKTATVLAELGPVLTELIDAELMTAEAAPKISSC